MAITITTTDVLLVALVAGVLYVTYELYLVLWLKPRAFLKYFDSQGVRGKPFRFLIGDLADIQEAAKKDEIVEYSVRQNHELGLVHTTLTGFKPVLGINDADLLRHLFTSKAHCYHKLEDGDKDIIRPLLHNGLLMSEDDYWKQQRNLVSPAFHFNNLKEMVPSMIQAIEACINKWMVKLDEQEKGESKKSAAGTIEVEMTHDMSVVTLDTVATAAFGTAFHADQTRADLFVKSLHYVLELIQQRTLSMVGFMPILKDIPFRSLVNVRKHCKVIDDICAQVIEQRKQGKSRAVGGSDLLDLLLCARTTDGAAMSDRAILEESINFLGAGAETTSNALTWILYRIITEKGVYDKCVEEVDRVLQGQVPDAETLKDLRYIEAVVYEGLRLHPPAAIIPKYAIAEHDLGDLHIPKGTFITINVSSLHRMEQYWPEPHAFKPERFLSGEEAAVKQHPFAFLAFSAGPRKCLGKNFALMEIKVILSLLLQRVTWEVVPGQKIVSDPITRLPKHGIYMKLRKRTDQPNYAALQATSNSNAAESASHGRVMKPLGMI